MNGLPRTMSATPDTSSDRADETLLLGAPAPRWPTSAPAWPLPEAEAPDADVVPAAPLNLRPPRTRPRLVCELDESDLERFLRLVRSGADPALGGFLRSLEGRGVSPERIIDELVTPTARHMGEAWLADECTFVDVTLAGGRLQQVVRSLVRSHAQTTATGRSGTMPRALLTSLPGEQHTLGLTVLSAHFRLAGWDVRVGPPVGRESGPALVRRMKIDVVGISIARAELLPTAREEIRRLRSSSCNADMGILVGGAGLGGAARAADVLDADAIAPSARLAPQVAWDFT